MTKSRFIVRWKHWHSIKIKIYNQYRETLKWHGNLWMYNLLGFLANALTWYESRQLPVGLSFLYALIDRKSINVKRNMLLLKSNLKALHWDDYSIRHICEATTDMNDSRMNAIYRHEKLSNWITSKIKLTITIFQDRATSFLEILFSSL